MLEVRFREDSRHRLSSVLARGHAGWADYGEDVVCAAVSAILQAAWLGLEAHAKVALQADRSEGNLALRWPKHDREREAVIAIVATARLSIEAIAHQYPEHVRVIIEPEDETAVANSGTSEE